MIQNNIDIAEVHRLDSMLADTKYIQEKIKRYTENKIRRETMIRQIKPAIDSLQDSLNEYEGVNK